MIFKDGKTFSAYVRSKLHSGYITLRYEIKTQEGLHDASNKHGGHKSQLYCSSFIFNYLPVV